MTTPTPEQQAILQSAKESKDSMMITAMAGTGKTSTLVLLANALPVQPAIALAFNVTIKKELERRFPPFWKVMTLNGLGHLAWMRAIRGKQVTLDERKLGRLTTAVMKDFSYEGDEDAWGNVRQLVEKAMQAGIVPAGKPHKGFRPDTAEQWAMLADENWLQGVGETEIAMAREVLARSVAEGFAGTISFSDQIYLPVLFNGQFPRYPLLMGDEVQDWSVMNRVMAQRTCSGRFILVGDPAQCHPLGTKIQLSRGVTKNIEDIQIGDQLVSFNRKTGFSGLNTQGTKVLDKKIFQFNGDLVRINTTGPYMHECTPNHRCLVRWTDKTCYCVYLMRKGNYFRIGTAQAWYNKEFGGFGPSMRGRQENADALWILDSFQDKDAALVAEKVIWTKFGLPDLIFRCSGKSSTTQKNLDAAWFEIGENLERAIACLKYYKRDIQFPLWIAGEKKHIGEKSFLTEACNIISDAMSVKVFDGKQDNQTWLPVYVNYTKYTGPVVGLTVAPNGFGRNLYIAEGIVTHNSIYNFRGADSASMTRLRALRPSWIDLPLSVTFRCPKVVVDRQQRHVPGFQAFHTNAIGEVKQFLKYEKQPNPQKPSEQLTVGPLTWDWSRVAAVAGKGTIAILSRNNAPLLKIAFKLLRQNVPVTMLGRDIGKTLVALSKRVLPDDDMLAPECVQTVEAWKDSQLALANANGQEDKAANIHDQAECLLAVIEGARAENAAAIRWYLKELFERSSGHVIISTIHRAKGLEWNCILHLDPWRIPSKHAQHNPVQMQQEMNLQYVCETRCSRILIEANLEDFE